MAAASTTMRPHSAASSGTSTPWLSPEASSSTWRGSYAASTDLSRRTSSGSTSGNTYSNMSGSEPSSSRDPHSQEWWENVLPPGQLAERLRKAQRSSSASRRRNNPALANATPSERSAWKRLSGLPTEKSDRTPSGSSTANSSRRSSFQGSTATLPRSALKSNHRMQDASALHFDNVSQSNSSAEVSSDEFGGTSTGHHSPERHVRYAFPSGYPASTQHDGSRRQGAYTTSNSPEMASSMWPGSSSTSPSLPSAFDSSRSGSRSTGSRRMRVMSEDGMASSILASQQSSSSSSYRLPSSHSAMRLNQFNANADSSSWSNIAAADRTRAKFTHHYLPDTPELSSDEANDVTTFTTSTTTTQRTRKVSTTKTTIQSSSKVPSPPTILRSHFDRPDQPPCPLGSGEAEGSRSTSPSRRDRHVSFEKATEIPRRASVHDCAEPMTTSQSAFSFSTLPSRECTSPFDTLPPRSNSTRRSRQGIRISGRRTTSFSLPGSRRGSIRGESPFTASSTPFAKGQGQGHSRSTSIPDAMLLDSLNVAHKQLASAGNLALTLTRQLSAPLRPVFHMTLFLSISSITVLSLACFLCASYMLTAWDDVSQRTARVGEVAGKTKHRFEKTLDWGLRMLGPQETGVRGSSKPTWPKEGRSEADSTCSPCHGGKESAKGSVSAAGHAFFWPARMAWSATSSVAYRVTPATISKLFQGEKTKPKAKASTLPPRPPLSTLLPSILFTLILAIGAGLSSFLASRRAAAAAGQGAAGGVGFGGNSGVQGYTVPSSTTTTTTGMEYVHFASASGSPFVGRRMPTATPAEGVKRRSVPVGGGSSAFVR